MAEGEAHHAALEETPPAYKNFASGFYVMQGLVILAPVGHLFTFSP